MNIFEALFLDVVLLIFPVLIYVIYLSSNKNVVERFKKIYFRLSLLTSFFLIYTYSFDTSKLIPVLVLSSIVLFSYLEDLYIFSSVLTCLILTTYINSFNNISFLLLSYIIISILYLLKRYKKINTTIFIELSIITNSIIYYLWIYLYNIEIYDMQLLVNVIICHIFLSNIILLMYGVGKIILKTHMDFKDLKQAEQIRLSLFKITHEIKNPIAVCKGYLDMINVKDEKQVERYIPIIKSEIERLLSLLQDFLSINKSNLDFDIMDINVLVEDTIDKLEPLIKENKINLNLNLLDDEVFINGDYNRLSQVVINIIKNSVEAMETVKKKKINILTKIDNNSYYLIIEDNGIGMTKEVLSKMREPFYTTKKRGSGLGVSLIYEIVEAHSGKVMYTSEYGSGTKVVLKLPIFE